MATASTMALIEKLVWILIYGGLLLIILGIVTGASHLLAGWSLGFLGGIAVVAGVVLIWVRSRMQHTTE